VECGLRHGIGKALFDKVLESSSDAGYLHFSCHGQFNLDNPDASGLKLALDSDDSKLSIPNFEELLETVGVRSEDGHIVRSITACKNQDRIETGYDSNNRIVSKRLLTRDGRSISVNVETEEPSGRMLTLAEIFHKLKLKSTRLVVLSACETGLVATSTKSDEFVGLPAGFLHAGAQAVVSSLWRVEDESTKDLMVRFYQNHLQNGMSPSQALRDAQRHMMKHKPNPYYWGAFIMTGL